MVALAAVGIAALLALVTYVIVSNVVRGGSGGGAGAAEPFGGSVAWRSAAGTTYTLALGVDGSLTLSGPSGLRWTAAEGWLDATTNADAEVAALIAARELPVPLTSNSGANGGLFGLGGHLVLGASAWPGLSWWTACGPWPAPSGALSAWQDTLLITQASGGDPLVDTTVLTSGVFRLVLTAGADLQVQQLDGTPVWSLAAGQGSAPVATNCT